MGRASAAGHRTTEGTAPHLSAHGRLRRARPVDRRTVSAVLGGHFYPCHGRRTPANGCCRAGAAGTRWRGTGARRCHSPDTRIQPRGITVAGTACRRWMGCDSPVRSACIAAPTARVSSASYRAAAASSHAPHPASRPRAPALTDLPAARPSSRRDVARSDACPHAPNSGQPTPRRAPTPPTRSP